MNQEVLDFLAKQPVGCLAVQLENGPHNAALHFSNTSGENGFFKLFMQTADDSKKVQPLQKDKKVPASFTAGFSLDEWITVQMDGAVRFLTEDEKDEYDRIHYTKHPESKKHAGPHTVYLVFEPTWWRFTDFNTSPKTIIES